MIPILNQHLKDELENETENIKEDKELEDENNAEEIEFSSSDSGMPICTKVGLGLLGAGAIGLTLCKLLNSESKDKI